MLDKDKIDDIFASKINQDIEVDLSNQAIKMDSDTHKFDIDSTLKNYLLEGIDEISTTLKYENFIRKYELENKSIMVD
jgi:3-isopropylmalate dehydratase small subunit